MSPTDDICGAFTRQMCVGLCQRTKKTHGLFGYGSRPVLCSNIWRSLWGVEGINKDNLDVNVIPGQNFLHKHICTLLGQNQSSWIKQTWFDLFLSAVVVTEIDHIPDPGCIFNNGHRKDVLYHAKLLSSSFLFRVTTAVSQQEKETPDSQQSMFADPKTLPGWKYPLPDNRRQCCPC